MPLFRTCILTISGLGVYSPSRPFQSEKETNETHETFDKRCWPEHCHVDSETKKKVIIPGTALKQGIDFAAQRLAIKKQGNSKWTADITSGLDIYGDIELKVNGEPLLIEDVIERDMFMDNFCHTNGQRGSGSRVWRRFPRIPAPWGGEAILHVYNEHIPAEIIERVVQQAGLISGLGRFRPQNAGSNGRFQVEFQWENA